MRLLRKKWVLIVFMNLIWLLIIDQINHWTSPLQLYLYPYSILVIFPALYLSPRYGLCITIISGLLASSYVFSPPAPILPQLIVLHVILQFFRHHFAHERLIPPFYLIAVISLAGVMLMLPFTTQTMLLQGAFWFRLLVDATYNAFCIPLLAYPFYLTQESLLGWADKK